MDADKTREYVRVSEVPQFVVAQEEAWHFIGSVTIAYQPQIYLCGVVLGMASLSSPFSSSSRPLKVFLATIVIMNVAYTGLRANLLTALAVEQHCDRFFILSRTMLSEALAPLLYILTATSSQVFFAIRVIRVLTRRLAKVVWLTAFVPLVLSSLAGWEGATQSEVEALLGRHTQYNDQGYNILELYGLSGHLVAAAATDVLISVTLAIRLRRETLGFNAQTDTVLRRIVRMTLTTGALTSVTASIAATATIMYEAEVFSSWAMQIVVYPLPSLYCLSVFWTLNLRSRLRQERQKRDAELSLAAVASERSRTVIRGLQTLPKVTLPDDVLKAGPFGPDFRQPRSVAERGFT